MPSHIRTKPATDQYRQGWDRVFGGKAPSPLPVQSYDFDTDMYVMGNGERWTGETVRWHFPWLTPRYTD